MTTSPEALFHENLDLARIEASRIARSSPRSFSYDEMYAAGLYGLYDAALKYRSGMAHFRTYSRSRVAGRILDDLRKTTDKRRSYDRPQRLSSITEDPVSDGEVTSVVDAIDLARYALSCLKNRDRAIVLLYFVNGLKQEEIGDCFGISGTRVSELLRRALNKMREALQREASKARQAQLPK